MMVESNEDEDWAILKCYTLGGNRYVYIGTNDMTINGVNKRNLIKIYKLVKFDR